MLLIAANDRFAPGAVVDLASFRMDQVDPYLHAEVDSWDFGYLLSYRGKRRVLTNLSTGRRLCALAG